MYVYAQVKKVTWNVYAHAQFSGGLYQAQGSIFILYQLLVVYWRFTASLENAHAYK